MKNKNTEDKAFDILVTFALFLLVCAGLALVMLFIWGISVLIKEIGGIVFVVTVIIIALAAIITYQIWKHCLK